MIWSFQAMRSPSILSQCLAGFLSHEKAAAHCVNVVPERESHPPSPAVEIVPSKVELLSTLSCSLQSCVAMVGSLCIDILMERTVIY